MRRLLSTLAAFEHGTVAVFDLSDYEKESR